MNNKVQLTYKNMTGNDRVGEYVDERYGKIRRLSSKIIRCNAVISVPHRSHRSGNDYHVSVVLNVPGQDLVAQADSRHADGGDLYTAISEAFDSLGHQLKGKRTKKLDANRQYLDGAFWVDDHRYDEMNESLLALSQESQEAQDESSVTVTL